MKPLASNHELTPDVGRSLRARGWRTIIAVERCVDCAAPTTWRCPDGVARHPWECELGGAR